jgi:hypothetical protein
MALSFTTGMTSIDPADSQTNWSIYKITAGGATPTLNNSTDILREGTQALSFKPTASKDVGASFDYYTANSSTTLNLTTAGNEVIGVWLQVTSSATLATFANGGVYIGVMGANAIPSSSNAWSKWYVAGSDFLEGGWVYYQVDTRKTPSATNSGGATLSTVYQIFFGTLASATVPRADSFYIDASWYGRPIYTLNGDGTLVADWADFLSHSTTNENGLIQDINGAYELSCGIQFGTNAQTATTTFTDATSQGINWKRHVYYSSGTVDALTYTDYYKLTAEGAASFGTTVTIGSLVGSDQGILGGQFKSVDPTNVSVTVDFTTDSAHITALNLYGVTWQGIRGTIQIGDKSAYKVYSNSFVDCGQVDPVGACVIRNSFFIDTASTTGALLWNSNIDIEDSQFVANTTGEGTEHDTIISVEAFSCDGAGSNTVCTKTGENFLTTVAVNDYAYNETDGSYAKVTSVDSNIQFTTDGLTGGTDNTFTSGDNISVSPAIGYTNLVFSGNTSDVTNSATGSDALFISKTGTSNPATSTGTAVFIGSVSVSFEAVDKNDAAIQSVRVTAYLVSDDTEIINTTTNASGLATTSYTGATPADFYYRYRKSSTGATKYVNLSGFGTIESGTGSIVKRSMQEDDKADPTI